LLAISDRLLPKGSSEVQTYHDYDDELMREHFHDKFIVKAKSSVSSHDQSKHSKNQSQTDASV
jgi:hypothetical protein